MSWVVNDGVLHLNFALLDSGGALSALDGGYGLLEVGVTPDSKWVILLVKDPLATVLLDLDLFFSQRLVKFTLHLFNTFLIGGFGHGCALRFSERGGNS